MPQVNTDALDAELHVADAPTAQAADSAAATAGADSVLTLPRDFEEAYAPFSPRLDTALLQGLEPVDAFVRAEDTTAEEREAWQDGLAPEPRLVQPGRSTVFLTMIALLFVMIAFNFRTISRLLKFYGEELVKIRKGRDNVFDDRPAGDTRVLILLLIQFVVCGGILLSGGISGLVEHDHALMTVPSVAKIIGIVGAYYLFQLAAYQTVGYTFATGEGRREWLRGFNASQALLGVSLTTPAVLVIFYPHTTATMAIIGLIVYLLARLLFIFKGVRIFYDKMSSLLYFILYLCTLEIIPLILVYKCSVFELLKF